MLNPNVLLDLARERRRELLDDASRSRRKLRVEAESLAAAEALLLGHPAHLIDARVRAEARRSGASAAFELPVGAR